MAEPFGKSIARRWFERDAPVVAPDLLNKVLVSSVGGLIVAGRITEVEAYTEDDPASHTFPGPTPRNAAMFGPAGHLYVYLSYGVHYCANVVVGAPGQGHAVLLRSVVVLGGVEMIRERRQRRPDRDLTNGPGKLGQAFAIDLAHYGIDLTDIKSSVQIVDDGVAPPVNPLIGPRIGITKAVDTPWRFRTP